MPYRKVHHGGQIHKGPGYAQIRHVRYPFLAAHVGVEIPVLQAERPRFGAKVRLFRFACRMGSGPPFQIPAFQQSPKPQQANKALPFSPSARSLPVSPGKENRFSITK
jgi:hypothetical protein